MTSVSISFQKRCKDRLFISNMQVYFAYFFVILINHFYLVDYKKTINTKKVFFNYYEEDFLLWNLSILFNNI